MNDTHARASAGGLRLLGTLILAALSAAGIWAIAVRLRDGLMVTHMTQHVPWGLWISLYIYFIGLSAGSFLLSTLIYVFGAKRFEAVGPLALIQALGCLLLGLLLVQVDLGRPERFLNIFLYWNPTSVLAWECLFYAGYAAILLVEILIVMRKAFVERARAGGTCAALCRLLAFGGALPADWDRTAARWMKTLGIIGIPVAIGVHGGTGAIFAVVKSRPTWYTGLFPILFLVSALASGGALLTFLAAVTSQLPLPRRTDLLQGLARMTVGIVCLDLLCVASETLVVFYGGMPHHREGWHQILFGPFAWVFWGVQLGLGALLPILIVSGRGTGRSPGWLGLSGLLVVLGVMGVRLNIVIPAQIPPEFAGLPAAYDHARFAYGYFPSANEWLVGLGTCALGFLAFLGLRRILPLAEAEQTAATHAAGGAA